MICPLAAPIYISTTVYFYSPVSLLTTAVPSRTTAYPLFNTPRPASRLTRFSPSSSVTSLLRSSAYGTRCTTSLTLISGLTSILSLLLLILTRGMSTSFYKGPRVLVRPFFIAICIITIARSLRLYSASPPLISLLFYSLAVLRLTSAFGSLWIYIKLVLITYRRTPSSPTYYGIPYLLFRTRS